MSRAGIEQLLYMMDQAFESDLGESLLANVASVPAELWSQVTPGGKRTIHEIVRHLAECKHVYDNHAFGDQSMRYEKPETMPRMAEDASPPDVVASLRAGQASLRGHVASLPDDEELVNMRYGWSLSFEMETRRVIAAMILHDAYHAGEINHIRALAQGND